MSVAGTREDKKRKIASAETLSLDFGVPLDRPHPSLIRGRSSSLTWTMLVRIGLRVLGHPSPCPFPIPHLALPALRVRATSTFALASSPVPPPPLSPRPPRILDLLRQSFLPFSSSPKPLAIRPTYYQDRARGSGSRYGGGGRGRGGDPFSTLRARFDRLPAMWVLGGVIGLNVAVFAAWNYGGEVYRKYRDPAWLLFLNKNFTVSWNNFSSGRV